MATKAARAKRGRPANTSSSCSKPCRLETSTPSKELEDAEALTSRPPSPQAEEMPSSALEDPEITILGTPLLVKEAAWVGNEIRASTDVEATSDEFEDSDPYGITARHGRAQSLDSARKELQNKELIYLNLNAQTLSAEQKETVNAASELLTEEQKEQVKRRQDKVMLHSKNDNEPETSLHKGKTTDPREWGNSGLAPEEMDIAVQKAILDAYERGRNAKRSVKTPKQRNDDPNESEIEENFQILPVAKHRGAMPTSLAQNLETRRAGSRPAAQIVPNSSLGIALGNTAQMSRGLDSSEPSDDESEYTTRSSSYSRSARSRSTSRSRQKRRLSTRKRSRKGT